ncbi:MAG: class I SAM-dependent rRNA methyltransferase [Gammaproteobacteria bacterium]|nr:class I SAM-dependent rRNA methyltransferase [Gammaproteobacteria bacterium]
MSNATLKLKKREDRRLRAGHGWIFSNEIDTKVTPLKGLVAGESVNIVSDSGQLLGSAYVNPASLICARMISRHANKTLDRALLQERIQRAHGLRDQLYATGHYRLVYGDSDFLPGLVIDRFDDVLVVQSSTAGIDVVMDDVKDVLTELFDPEAIILRNDSGARDLENLERYTRVIHGDMPDKLRIEENGLRFEVPTTDSQKTGWFYDQQDNRRRLNRYVAGKSVLDVFSYAGGWGIHAAHYGARDVACVDASEAALESVKRNAELNSLDSFVRTIKGDAFEVLKHLKESGEMFDVVILDPPAFIKRKKDMDSGSIAYERLNKAGLQLVNDGGVLISCSCSHHMSADNLQRAILKAAQKSRHQLQILETGEQGPDHPVHPAIAETRYLKAFYCRVLNT